MCSFVKNLYLQQYFTEANEKHEHNPKNKKESLSFFFLAPTSKSLTSLSPQRGVAFHASGMGRGALLMPAQGVETPVNAGASGRKPCCAALWRGVAVNASAMGGELLSAQHQGEGGPVDAAVMGREPCRVAPRRGIAVSPAPGGEGPVNAADTE